MVIPLGAKRRQRGLELWMKAGRFLGAKGFATGGMVGGAPLPAPPITREGQQAPPPRGGNNVTFNVNVGGINLEVKVDEGKSVLDSINEQKDKIAEEIAAILNRALEAQYQNMPAI